MYAAARWLVIGGLRQSGLMASEGCRHQVGWEQAHLRRAVVLGVTVVAPPSDDDLGGTTHDAARPTGPALAAPSGRA